MPAIDKIDINKGTHLQVATGRLTRHEAIDISGSFVVRVEENARYEAFFLMRGQKADIRVELQGKNASCDLKIVYLSAAETDNVIMTDIRHTHPETFSSEIIKGVLVETGQTQFDGVIRIPFDSQKCEGSQNHQAILLSDKATVKCTPELEIYADDVKCSHGSAIGALNEEQLFYLRTRGIPQAEAQKMLIKGFLSEITPDDKISLIEDWMDAHE